MKKLIYFFGFLCVFLISCENPFVKLEVIEREVGNGDSFIQLEYCKVTYHFDGANPQNDIWKTQSYEKGSVVKFPSNPEKEGYNFVGWYKSKDYAERVNNSTLQIQEDIDLYGRFDEIEKSYTVKFLNDDLSSVANYELKKASESVDVPAAPVSKVNSGWSFSGWYRNKEGTGVSLATATYLVNPEDSNTDGEIVFYACYLDPDELIPVSGITFEQGTDVSVQLDGTVKLIPVFVPENANTGKTLTWTSSDIQVATVNDYGLVTPLKAGTTTIKAENTDGVYAECAVTVKEVVDYSLSLDQTVLNLTKGETGTLIHTVTPAGTPVLWSSNNNTVATVTQDGLVEAVGAGTAVITCKIADSTESATCTVVVKEISSGFTGIKIYVSASSAPTLWVWQADGLACSDAMGQTYPGNTLEPATDLNNNAGWYVWECSPDYYTEGKVFSYQLNRGPDTSSGKTATFYLDAAGLVGEKNTYYDSDPTTVPEPEAPSITITPAGGDISLYGSITITINPGNDIISNASVTVTGGANKTYNYGDFTSNKLVIPVSDLTSSECSLTVKASVTNSVGTADASTSYSTKDVKPDSFTWDNVLCYFVLTDRFYNGDTANDYSYYRKNAASNPGIPDVATFHGGDIKGLTDKLDYFDTLGVNAIWITAPYEQVHGWVSGKNNAFPHYAFHGYYTLDWTYMDRNMGTIEEFRTFVNEAHKRGIRVVMDIVMNHVGYNNTEDMITYEHGYTEHKEHGWLEQVGGEWNANDTVLFEDSYWENWWGPWIRSFGYAEGTEYGGSCGGLPDVKSELTSSVGLAPVLVKKWSMETAAEYTPYKLPSVAQVDWYGRTGDWRTDQNVPPVQYQIMWLSAWVREFGIDGFRCDTQKHVEDVYWGQLKDACQEALIAWRGDSSKSDGGSGAKLWDENFWMTGECFGWTSTAGQGSAYTTGKFDSMINFSFNGSSGGTGRTPTESDWSSYASINQNNPDSDGNGNINNVLSYVSSHDTGLHRPGDQRVLGTMLCLLPGGVQIFYGDETARPGIDGYGDADMSTRGDMNWDAATAESAVHWSKIGKFRKFNPAVGAGIQTVSGTTYKRVYTGTAGSNQVAICISGSAADVSGMFGDGTTVYNWYDGSSAVVSGGAVSFSGSASTTSPWLISDLNPADF